MLEKFKDFCVLHTYGDFDFNDAHPIYCVVTVVICIASIVWAIFDGIWRYVIWKKKEAK